MRGLSLGLGLSRSKAGAAPAITIASLFDGGVPGIYVRPRPDTGTVWTDAGSTAAGDADVLGQIDALAGSVASYGQTSPAAKPILRNRGSEGWLAEFDGGNDDMITNATVDFSGVSTVTFVGYVKATVLDGSIQRLLVHGTGTTGDGRLFIQAPQSSTNHFRAIMTGGGNPAVDATGATYAPPQGRVVRAEFTTANRVRLWLDGVFIGEDTGTGTTFLNDSLLIGSLARTLFHQGEIGSHAWIGDALTAGEASAAEAEIAADHGITLGAATAPSAFTSGDWSVANDASTVTISTLPADGGSAITDIEYRVNSGTAVSLGQTTTGTYAITASGGDDIEIRAVNSVGAGAWSDTKTIFTPASLFASGETGWQIDATSDDTFRAPDNLTLSSVTESSGFALDESEGAGYSGGNFTGLGSELVTNGTFDADVSGWAAVGTNAGEDVSFSWSSGKMLIERGSGSIVGRPEQQVSVESGKPYLLSLTLSEVSSSAVVRIGTTSGGDQYYGNISAGNGTIELVYIPVTATTYVSFWCSTNANFKLDDVTIREIPGDHGIQTNSSFRPVLRADGLEYDGTDDRLTTTRTPSTSGTLIAKFNGTTAGRVIMGSQPASDGRAYLALDASGRLAAGIGTQGTATIFAGSDIRSADHVGAVTWDGTTVKLYLDGTEIYSAAQSGAANTTVEMHIGALNANGTASAFWDGIIGQSIAIDRVLTATEISNLTTFWS